MQFKGCLYVALALLQPCHSQTLSEDTVLSPDESFTMHQNREAAFKLYQNYLIVTQGTLGTLERQNLLIDTGANITSIGGRVARKLELTGHHVKLALVGEAKEVERTILPNIEIGPFRAESLPVVVQDLAFVEKAAGVKIDAIVGLDVLKRSSFTIDYESKKILFGPVESGALEVPFESGAPIVSLEIRLNGQPVRLLLDTGTPNLLLFDRHLPVALRNLPVRNIRQSFNSAARSSEMKEVLVGAVQIGKMDFGVRKALMTSEGSYFDPSLDGAVGPVSLGWRRVAFDFEHKLVSCIR